MLRDFGKSCLSDIINVVNIDLIVIIFNYTSHKDSLSRLTTK